ncbi:Cht2 GPI-linked chitinase [Candida orthopsilosis Co 90-125]|uniref:chitinase n=1 Tax=Candida orthopsilosis (strain 90-125) TaxID=1136231 RepID=H8X0Q8_CANO9|nr:Cht2 GPI-linked chitinase [Candida orthopsilosis Co 90-125]CCG21947.1 Cht2 GPI-linked chitinase [Candida orthopsilosis Co 90-125]
MLSNTLLALLATSASALAASNSVAVYWGQNGAGGQDRLSTYCADSSVDVVILSFLNDFPDPTNVNFANQCGATYPSGLLHCSAIGEDIKTCQASGKKVLLSLGGAAGNYGFSSTGDATAFADTLWNKFGNGEDEERPFDDAVVDGFDFDIELGSSTGYPELATALKSKFDSSKKYYLSASPQCVYPDAHVGPLLEQVPLDFAFIQFYNNPCSVDGDFNYDTWAQFAESSPNPDLKLYVGVPATGNVAGYVDAATLAKTIDQIKCDEHFAGVSLWDASGAWINTDASGANFADQVKKVLNDNTCPAPSSSSSSSSSSSTSAPASSTENKDIVDPTSVVVSPSGGYKNTTSTNDPIVSTATDIHTTIVTITSCEANKCSEVPVTTGVLTISEVDTVYTTYCPLPTTSAKPTTTAKPSTSVKASVSTASNVETTIVTITSCEANKCSEVPVTTGVVTVTDVNTVYTTYCPLPTTTSAAAPAPVAPVESSSAPAAETTAAQTVQTSEAEAVTTVGTGAEAETLTTTFELTSTVAPEQAPSSSVAAPEIISTYEGAAASNKAMWFTVPLVFVAALL